MHVIIHQILLGRSNKGERGGRGMWQAREGGGNLYRILVGKLEGKTPLEKPRCRWENGRLVGGMYWIHLAQDRDVWRAVVNAVVELRFLAPRI
jgi:hypothetical protein